MLLHSVPFKKQTGAALLALMLVLIIGSSYFLVTKLNTNLALTRQSEETGLALNAAKIALIGYAITFPDHDDSGVIDGPGYLPCPDLNNDGSAASNCSAGGNTTIGRLPNQTLRLEELRDASGQRLWYALSENFRFGTWKTIPLNSESPSSAELTINVTTDDIVAIIFAPGVPVIGQNRDPSVTSITAEISNYLEGDNNNLDTSFVTTLGGTTRKDGEYDNNDNYIFNDRLVVITRQELMEAVEKRVLGEVRKMLTDYFNDPDYGGAYPWLTPFADPKTDMRRLRGDAGPDSTGLVLDDNNQDFNEWGVAVNDVVYNITDGSIGSISNVNDSTRITVSSLLFGTLNAFADDDVYIIVPSASSLNSAFSGTASAGSSGLILEDTFKNFKDLGVAAGDIVENLSDIFGSTWSSGMVESVTATKITVKAMSGGDENDFDPGENYQIRSNVGQATGGSGGQVLEDTSKNFNAMNVLAGDLVVNHTDGSIGRVSSSVAVTANTLTVDELKYGSDNSFEVNDYYSLPRYNANNTTREGLLAFHEVGKHFSTALNIDWNFATAATTDISFDAVTFPGVQATYSTALTTYLNSYAEDGGTQSFDNSISTCIWATSNIADCYGSFKDFVNISGTLTSGSNTVTITDSTAQFNTKGIKRGDIAQNYDDESSVVSGIADTGSAGTTLVDAAVDFSVYEPYSYVIQNNTLEIDLSVARIQGVISDIIDANTLVAVSYVGQDSTPIEFRVGDSYTIFQPDKTVVTSVPSQDQLNTSGYTQTDSFILPYFPDFDNGEYYRIMPAANSYSGTVTSVVSTGTPDRFRDTSANFLTEGISVGDIIENTTIGAFGEIIAVITDGIETTLYNGTPNDFTVGDSYTVYHDHVFSREHIFHAKFRDNQGTNTVSEERVRDVCLGYSSDCSTVSTAVSFSGNGGTPLITLRDYEEDETTEVGRATFTPTSASSGSIRVSNIDYYLQEADGEIPNWFITNKWHQLIYIAYSVDDAPGMAGTCPGADCLTLEQTDGTNTLTNNAVRAIVLIAGEETQTTLDSTCSVVAAVDQDRSTGTMNEYFELKNCDGDDEFQQVKLPTTLNFNDQLKIIN